VIREIWQVVQAEAGEPADQIDPARVRIAARHLRSMAAGTDKNARDYEPLLRTTAAPPRMVRSSAIRPAEASTR
jgi:hypothetical protein